MCEDLERIWSNGQLAVLKKALTAAAELSVGLLEATEVVEPNPIRLMRVQATQTCTTVIGMGCIFIWTPSADRSKMPSGKVRNKYEQ